MIRAHRRSITACLVLVFMGGVSLSADKVKLRSGKVVEGMFMGADSKSVRVLLDDGQVSEIPIEQAVAVEFSARKPAPKPTPPPPPPPPAAARGAAAAAGARVAGGRARGPPPRRPPAR